MKKFFLALAACAVLFAACDDSSSSPNSDNKSSAKSNSCSNADEPLTDPRDGKVYKTVKIGNQVWMAENLNYDVEGSWTNDSLDKDGSIYGRYYTLDASKNACPEGWHLPSYDEADSLIIFVGNEDIAGWHLKSTSGWEFDSHDQTDGNGADTYCFDAKSAGEIVSFPRVSNFGEMAFFRTTATYRQFEYIEGRGNVETELQAWYLTLWNTDSIGKLKHFDADEATSIRCIKGYVEPESSSSYENEYTEHNEVLSDSLKQEIEKQQHNEELIKLIDSLEKLSDCDTVEGLTEEERPLCKQRFCSVQMGLEVFDDCIQQGII